MNEVDLLKRATGQCTGARRTEYGAPNTLAALLWRATHAATVCRNLYAKFYLSEHRTRIWLNIYSRWWQLHAPKLDSHQRLVCSKHGSNSHRTGNSRSEWESRDWKGNKRKRKSRKRFTTIKFILLVSLAAASSSPSLSMSLYVLCWCCLNIGPFKIKWKSFRWREHPRKHNNTYK